MSLGPRKDPRKLFLCGGNPTNAAAAKPAGAVVAGPTPTLFTAYVTTI